MDLGPGVLKEKCSQVHLTLPALAWFCGRPSPYASFLHVGFRVVPNNKYEPLPAKSLLAWLLASMLNRGGRFQLGRAPPLA